MRPNSARSLTTQGSPTYKMRSQWNCRSGTKMIIKTMAQRSIGHIGYNEKGVARPRELEHSRNDIETRFIRCRGKSARLRKYCNKMQDPQLKDSETLDDSNPEDFLWSETVGFTEQAQEQADRSELRQTARARNAPTNLEKSGPIFLWLRVTMWNTEQSTKPNKMTIGTSRTAQGRMRSRLSKTTRLGNQCDHTQTRT